MTLTYLAPLAAIAAILASHASAQEFGDSRKGETIARMVCAECHAVDTRLTLSPNSNAPAFITVAKTSGMTAMALRTWLQTSHPTMPNIILKNEDRDNVIAYILKLNAPNTGL